MTEAVRCWVAGKLSDWLTNLWVKPTSYKTGFEQTSKKKKPVYLQQPESTASWQLVMLWTKPAGSCCHFQSQLILIISSASCTSCVGLLLNYIECVFSIVWQPRQGNNKQEKHPAVSTITSSLSPIEPVSSQGWSPPGTHWHQSWTSLCSLLNGLRQTTLQLFPHKYVGAAHHKKKLCQLLQSTTQTALPLMPFWWHHQ